MKKLSFVIASLGGGGSERVLVNLTRRLAVLGYDVTIYTIISDEVSYTLHENVRHIYIDKYAKFKLFRIIKRFFALKRVLRADESDTVVAFDTFYGVSAALFSGKRVVASERNDPRNIVTNKGLRHLRKFLFKRADRIVFQTDYAKEYFCDRIKEKGVVIPNFVGEDLPQAKEYGGNRRIIAACRLEKQKNLPMMAEAFEIFDKAVPGYTLEIYGEGSLRSEILELISAKGLCEKVRLMGFAEDLYSLLNGSAMYISTSDFEGISNSMIEALALGVPVVCTDCPAFGGRLFIENGVSGYLTPVGDAQKFAGAMINTAKTLQTDVKRRDMAAKVREKFSLEKITEKWIDIF